MYCEWGGPVNDNGAHTQKPLRERATDLLPHVQYRRAHTEQDLEAIYRLRHDAYVREGALEPGSTGMLTDKFDDGPHAYQVGLYLEGKLASCIRIHLVTRDRRRSPALESFGEVLNSELDAGKSVVDPNRFMVDHRASRAHPELPFLTLRVPFMAAAYFDADFVTATVRREHQPFYRRELLMHPVSEPKPYPMLTKPIGLMMVDFRASASEVLRRRPFYASTPAEREQLFGLRALASRASEVDATPPQGFIAKSGPKFRSFYLGAPSCLASLVP
jgi:N-acyl-L-homoserine lactone synthetase